MATDKLKLACVCSIHSTKGLDRLKLICRAIDTLKGGGSMTALDVTYKHDLTLVLIQDSMQNEAFHDL